MSNEEEYFNFFTVKAEMKLTRNDNIIQRDNRSTLLSRVKLTEKEKKKLEKTAPKILKDPDTRMWLFYSTELKGIIYFLDEKCSIVNGIPIFTFILQYSLDKKCTPEFLKEEVKEIFEHWEWSGDISFSLKSFKVLFQNNLSSSEKSSPHSIVKNKPGSFF